MVPPETPMTAQGEDRRLDWQKRIVRMSLESAELSAAPS